MSSGQTVQVIAFAVMFGIVLSMKNEESSGSKILEMIRYFNEIIMGMMHIILKLAPIGIFALLGWVTGVIGFEVIIPLAKFLLALLVAAILTFLGMLLPVCILCQAFSRQIRPQTVPNGSYCFHHDIGGGCVAY